MEKIDLLIRAAHVVPVAPRGVLEDHAVAVREGRIVAVLPAADAAARFEARESVHLDHHVLMPGFVNIHSHAAMSLMRVVVLAEELDCPIHMHVHETSTEVAEGFAQHGARPLSRMASLGLVGPRLIAVHAVHLDDRELDMMAREGVSVAHCPSSNLK